MDWNKLKAFYEVAINKWELRFAHYPHNQSSLNYWKEGKNPDYKTKKERDAQYKKDIKKIKKTNPYY